MKHVFPFLKVLAAWRLITTSAMLVVCAALIIVDVVPMSHVAAQITGQGQPRLPTITLTVGKHKVLAEVAAAPETRERGLMFRYDMKENEGMLFVFPNPQRLAFWMKNTPLPLSIAFIDTQGVIVNIRDMMPFTLDSHPSDGDALYALEVHRGWFAQRGIKAGDRVQGLDQAGRGR